MPRGPGGPRRAARPLRGNEGAHRGKGRPAPPPSLAATCCRPDPAPPRGRKAKIGETGASRIPTISGEDGGRVSVGVAGRGRGRGRGRGVGGAAGARERVGAASCGSGRVAPRSAAGPRPRVRTDQCRRPRPEKQARASGRRGLRVLRGNEPRGGRTLGVSCTREAARETQRPRAARFCVRVPTSVRREAGWRLPGPGGGDASRRLMGPR